MFVIFLIMIGIVVFQRVCLLVCLSHGTYFSARNIRRQDHQRQNNPQQIRVSKLVGIIIVIDAVSKMQSQKQMLPHFLPSFSMSICSRSDVTLPPTRQQSVLSNHASRHPRQFVNEIDGFLARLDSLHARSEKCRESLARIEVDFESLAPAMERRAIYCSMDSDEMNELVRIND